MTFVNRTITLILLNIQSLLLIKNVTLIKIKFMKNLVIPFVAFASIFTMQSCSKCGHCEYNLNTDPSATYCGSDYNDAKATCEGVGTSGNWIEE